MSARVPDLAVERLLAGELSDADAADVRARLEAEAGGAQRLADLEADGRDLLQRMPPRVFAAAVLTRAEREAPRRTWAFALVPALAGALALLLAVPAVLQPTSTDGIEVVRAKGDPIVQIHRQGDDEPLQDGEIARAGDLVQVSYTASGASYGAILSVDGRGTVTRHLPDRGKRASKLLPGGGVPLGQSYELDDAPSFERFLFVTASHPFDVDAVEHELEGWVSGDVKELALDPSLRTTLFTVGKEGSR